MQMKASAHKTLLSDLQKRMGLVYLKDPWHTLGRNVCVRCSMVVL